MKKMRPGKKEKLITKRLAQIANHVWGEAYPFANFKSLKPGVPAIYQITPKITLVLVKGDTKSRNDVKVEAHKYALDAHCPVGKNESYIIIGNKSLMADDVKKVSGKLTRGNDTVYLENTGGVDKLIANGKAREVPFDKILIIPRLVPHANSNSHLPND
ncbi:MAG: hypothetical protein FWG18_03350, partial [Alphaproteobacteria bacterium]|nr:hypothetical protein [Alphaproteobacteria bacterium]